MTNAPTTVGLVHNGFGGWRLWTADDADDPTVFPVPYILAAEQERLTAGRDAEIARLRDALSERDGGTHDSDCKALREALSEIARQKRTDELDTEYDVDVADFEGGYDAIINVARAALGDDNG